MYLNNPREQNSFYPSEGDEVVRVLILEYRFFAGSVARVGGSWNFGTIFYESDC